MVSSRNWNHAWPGFSLRSRLDVDFVFSFFVSTGALVGEMNRTVLVRACIDVGLGKRRR
jgi:hypothetical protein